MRALAVLAVGLLIGVAAVLGVSSSGPVDRPAPTFTSNLWAGFSGWGFTQTSINNPGPTITVTPGELVQLTLNSVDAAHTFLLDYNGDNISDPGEPLAAPFSPSPGGSPFNFVAPLTVGQWWYSCTLHGWDAMRGRFVVAGNAAPTISLTNPDGVATNRWTGGLPQRLSWTMSDPDGLPSQLAVYLNYTSSAGNGVIAGPPTLPLGATFYNWNVPFINANDAHVVATVIDPGGARGGDDNLIPIIDSTAPTVTATVPTTGAINVDPATAVSVTFSELMNQPSAEAAVQLCRQPGCVPVTLNLVGWSGNTVTFQPSPALAANGDYQGTVQATALDASNPGNPMTAPHVWTFRTTNSPPSVSILFPTAGVRLTGGSSHVIQWSVTDAEDLCDGLTVWINYSATGNPPWTPVLGPVTGCMPTFSWTVPTDDTTTARLQFEVNDTGGAKTTVLSGAFAVDSTAPTITGTNPVDGTPNVPLGASVVVTFSEPMNAGATGTPAVVGLEQVGGPWVQVSFAWDPANQVLTVNPTPLLTASTQYRLHVNGTALDASDPGNPLGAATTVTFTTAATADTQAPIIASVLATPPTQVKDGFVNLSAIVTDNVAVASVAANVSVPGGTFVNLTMTLVSGSTYEADQNWSTVGSYTFTVWASDTSNNWGSAPGSFVITAAGGDTTPPTIVHTSPGTASVGAAITLSATVTDDDQVAGVWVVFEAPLPQGIGANVSMTAGAGNAYTLTIPAQAAAGPIRYRIVAEDPSGNWAVSPAYTIQVLPEGTPPGPNYALYGGVLAVLAVLVIVAALVLRRRKKQGGLESPPP